MAAKQSEYAQKVGKLIDDTFVGISLALGVQTGLFDVILQSDLPMTSSELAAKAKMKERYVREWLRCMLIGGVVEADQKGDAFFVSKEHRQELSAMLMPAHFLAPVIATFPTIQQCFLLQGPAGASGDIFQEANGELEKAGMDETIDVEFLQNVPGLKDKLESGIEVGEFGGNRGNILVKLAQRFPQSRFRGSDLDEEAVREAQERVRALGLQNVSFHVVDLCRLPQDWVASFHWVFVRDVIHDLPQPEEGLKSIHQSLKEGGLCSVIDINASSSPQDNVGKPLMGMVHTASTFYCIPGALRQNPESVALGAVWGVEKAKEMFGTSGFRMVYDGPFAHMPMLYHYVLQK